MRLVTYTGSDNVYKIGALIDEYVLELQYAHTLIYSNQLPAFESILDLITQGEDAWNITQSLVNECPQKALVPLKDVSLQAPLPLPAQIRDFSAFEAHVKQAPVGQRWLQAKLVNKEPDEVDIPVPEIWYKQPLYYKPSRFTVSGHEDVIAWPSYSCVMDYELEIAAVIGRPGKDISAANAFDHVFGLTIYNDLSARDVQGKEMQGRFGPSKGKDFEGSNVFGPCITTMDEIGDPRNLKMVARVNGEEWSRGNTKEMHWGFDQIIEHVSRSETLHPGEILGSGTIGNGCGMEQMRYLKNGDIVELEIERIGLLRTTVIAS